MILRMLCNWFIACESITKLCRKFDDMEDLRWKNMAPWMTSLWSTTSCSKWLNFLFVEGTCLQSKASPQSTKAFRNWQINVFSPTVLYWSVLRARHLSWANLNEGDSAHIVIYILKWLLLPALSPLTHFYFNAEILNPNRKRERVLI